MASVDSVSTRHFRIGVVATALRTEIATLREQYLSLYGHWEVQGAGEREIMIEVTRRSRSRFGRRRYLVNANRRVEYEPTRTDEVLPYVEWAVNWEVPRIMPEFLQLHASSLNCDGVGVILPGHSGSGKSTLTAGLLARGWGYHCDEFALIHTRTHELHAYPKAICVKQPSFEAVRSVGLGIHKNRHFFKGSKGYVGFVDPLSVRPDVVGGPCPVRYVIFPKYAAGATPTLIPLSQGEAAFRLHAYCFNLLNCDAVGLDVIAAVVRESLCYELTAGDLGETCELIEGAVRGGRVALARSA